MAKKDKRLYTIPDELLLTRAKVMKNTVEAALPRYAARFPWIDALYLASFQSDIDTAAKLAPDHWLRTDIKVLASEVKALMADGKNKLTDLYSYSATAYRNNKQKQHALGAKRLRAARSNTSGMISLLLHAGNLAKKNPYQTDLTNRGYTQDEIDALLILGNDLKNKNDLLQQAKTIRKPATQQRKMMYNNVFSRMKLLKKCAKVLELTSRF